MTAIAPPSMAPAGRIAVRVGPAGLPGTLDVPDSPRGLVIVANGADDHLYVAGNSLVARALRAHGFATLEVSLLTHREAIADAETSELRFDIDFLATRFCEVARWAARQSTCRHLDVGVFAAGTCAAAAVQAAAEDPEHIDAVACRAARPELARDAFAYLASETLLLIGERDVAHFDAYRTALVTAPVGTVDVVLIPDGRPLLDSFAERKAVADVAASWFARALNGERWRGWQSDAARLLQLSRASQG